MLPDLIIIGAMKCGTSSLYRYLASHPETVPSFKKETDFFRTERDFDKGIKWYEAQFRSPGSFAFEASPNYSKCHVFPGVPERMSHVLPNVKLIYLVRDPVKRIVSHFMHNVSQGCESDSLKNALIRKKINYIQTSKYYYQLEQFLEFYKKDNILVIESESLELDANASLVRVFEFRGLDALYDPGVVERKFHASSEKKVASKVERYFLSRGANRYMKAGVRVLASPFQKTVSKPKLSKEEIDIINDALFEDIEKLRAFSGLEFSGWSL